MRYALREAFSAFGRTPLLSALAVALVALSLYVIGLFGIVAHNLSGALTGLESRVEVVAYLKDGTDAAELEVAQGELSQLPEVARVGLVDKDSARVRAQSVLPDFDEIFPDAAINPLPASLELALNDGAHDPESVERVAALARNYPFVESVEYGRDWVERLYELRRMTGLASATLGLAFAGVATLIIALALRIAVFARRDEIHVMRLVGARDGFIRLPFLIEGSLTGALGGLVALAFVIVTFSAAGRIIPGLLWLPLPWIAGGLLAGIGFGGLASALAVRKHLREVA
jgi:cell division transport system permease protein